MGISKNLNFRLRIDPVILVCYLLLLLVGAISICGASGTFDSTELFQAGSRPMKQLTWIALAFIISIAILIIDNRNRSAMAPLIYIAVMILMLVTVFVAPDIKGSRSWLVIGPIRLQSAEFAKVATALMLASLFDRHGFKLASTKSYLQVFGIILLPILLSILQKETGSALVFTVFFLALYREGLSGYFISFAALAVVIFVVILYTADIMWGGHTTADLLMAAAITELSTLILLAKVSRKKHRYHIKYLLTCALSALIISAGFSLIAPFNYATTAFVVLFLTVLYIGFLALRFSSRRYFFVFLFSIATIVYSFSVNIVYEKILQPHQQERIAVALGIKEDVRGAGYNVNQAKIAIGSGGLWGKGFMKGTQTKLNYVPEQDTDFIFCTIGEEYGFLGSIFLLLLYLTLILRIIYLAEKQTSPFGRVYGYSTASIFIFHIAINIGMVLGLVPVIGIPLPFISYGGSSLWAFTILLFIFIKIDNDRRLERIERIAPSRWSLPLKH